MVFKHEYLKSQFIIMEMYLMSY